ncbi:MAG: hypothetical protein A2Y15_02695 [Clostridiales bacterium GWF2_36_10]|nr:MAG: hypothetical protein A2Y15_02695 [Clostridiales bacterium GWF2_36_10]HAN21142.1 DUF1385 domain-containing protein [Clostridiales bacterium]
MSENKDQKCRLGTVGGQAVMEGVMMRSKTTTAIAVRNLETKKITARVKPSKTIRDKVKFFRLPIIRGIVNFIEMMILSFSTLTASTEMLGIEEEKPSKFEKWLEKRFGASLMGFISVIATILGLGLSIFLFIYLPSGSAKLVDNFVEGDMNQYIKAFIEGFMKIAIFVAYLALVSLIPDIKRVFMYHGAEHKSIFCYESGEELTVENVKKHTRFHPRCGTSFMFVMIIISIIAGALIPTWDPLILRVFIKIMILPFIVGIGYEFIMYAGKHTNFLTKTLSAPGLWMQRITTKEPDDSMIEVAIISIKAALPNEFPDFIVPLEEKTADKKEENTTAKEEKAADENI